MTPLPPFGPLLAGLAFHAALRRLAVPSEQIFVVQTIVEETPWMRVHVHVHPAGPTCELGDCRLIIDCGPAPSHLPMLWAQLTQQYNAGDYDEDTFKDAYERTLVKAGGSVRLVTLAMDRRIGRYATMGTSTAFKGMIPKAQS